MIGQYSGMRAQPFLAVCCRLYAMPVHLRFFFVLGVLLASSFVHSAPAEIADDLCFPMRSMFTELPCKPGDLDGYLGKGLFITAAHVVGRGWFTRPKIAISGQEYPTRIVKEGSFEGTDVTVLAVQESLLPMRLQMRRMKLCAKEPWPGEQVVTVVPERSVRTHILSPAKLPSDVRKFSTVIADVARTGNSGSGVFDVQQRCLLGIMSRKISVSRTRPDTGKTELVDLAKYFVPAFEIRTFLPPDTGENLDQ